MNSQDGRVALVSGGNRGIGLAVVRGLAVSGMTVFMGARDRSSGEAAQRTTANGAGEIRVEALDVTDPASIRSCIAAIERDLGRLDVLVNNAGVVLDGSGRSQASQPDFDVVKDTLEVNLFGAWGLAVEALPLMRAGGGRRIINVSSGMGQLSDIGGGAPGYRVSKAALNALTRMLATELGEGFSVNSVCPGWVRTDLGGSAASRSPAQGADTITWLATLTDKVLPTGGLYRDREPIPW